MRHTQTHTHTKASLPARTPLAIALAALLTIGTVLPTQAAEDAPSVNQADPTAVAAQGPVAPDAAENAAAAVQPSPWDASPEARAAKALATKAGFNLPGSHWLNQHLTLVYTRNTTIPESSAPSALAEAPMDLDGITLKNHEGQDITLADWQKDAAVDGLLVLHRGQIVYEHYAHGMSRESSHAMWSMSKSLTGLLAADLIQSGQLDAHAPVTQYLPELQGSAWEGATVQQTLDMTTAVNYAERPDANPGVVQYAHAAGLLDVNIFYTGPKNILDFLKSLQKNGEHGARFEYKTVDAEVIGLILSRITGQSMPELIKTRLWHPMGAGNAAWLLHDKQDTALAGAGFGSSLHDMARFGELVRLEGRFNGQNILQPGTVADLRNGGDATAFRAGRANTREGSNYHNQWWIASANDHSLEARGFGGQRLYIDPQNEIVIVKLASEVNLNVEPVPTGLDQAAFDAITTAVTQAR